MRVTGLKELTDSDLEEFILRTGAYAGVQRVARSTGCGFCTEYFTTNDGCDACPLSSWHHAYTEVNLGKHGVCSQRYAMMENGDMRRAYDDAMCEQRRRKRAKVRLDT